MDERSGTSVRQEPARSLFVTPVEFDVLVTRLTGLDSHPVPDQSAGVEFELGKQAADHMLGALRLRVDTPLLLYDGTGRGAHATVSSVDRRTLHVRVTDLFELPRRSYSITLYQALIKGARFDTVVEKATELGVDRIVPVICERSVTESGARAASSGASGASKRVERWRRIAAEAAKQCERGVLPLVDEAERLTDVCAGPFAGSGGYDLVIVAWEGASLSTEALLRESVTRAIRSPFKCAIVIGPEGGFTGPEMELLARGSATVVSLGPDVLRSETAAIAALALVGQSVRVAMTGLE